MLARYVVDIHCWCGRNCCCSNCNVVAVDSRNVVDYTLADFGHFDLADFVGYNLEDFAVENFEDYSVRFHLYPLVEDKPCYSMD